MQLTNFIVSLAAATAASAAAIKRTESCGHATYGPFGIMSLRSASPIHFGTVSAAQSSFYLHLPEQNATCEADADADGNNGAAFKVVDGNLFLYTPSGTVQQAFVDRSGMGQGVMQFTTGDQGIPRNAEQTGFEVDEFENLSFKGAGFIACPGATDDAWSIWVSVGIEKPAGLEGCLGFSARTVPLENADKCTYTQQ